MDKMDALGGKKLHAVFITKAFWMTADAASELRMRIEERRNYGERYRAAFMKMFHVFFTNTKVIIRGQDEEIVKKIDNEFRHLKFRNNNELLDLIVLWELYSESVQESPLMDLIKGAMVMGDE